MTWIASIALKYFAALLYALGVWAIQAVVWNLVPNPRWRRLLFMPLAVGKKQRIDAVARQKRRRGAA